MTRSSLPEETPATPGWVDGRINQVFAAFGVTTESACRAYADCLAGVRGRADVDAGHDACRQQLLAAVRDHVGDESGLDRALQALEAEISADT